KKNKAKYNPVHDIPVPLGPIIIPCASAQAKMKKGSFCDLWYFSNHGGKVVEKSATAHDDLDYVAIQRDGNNSRVLIVAFTSKLPTLRSHNRKDEIHKPILNKDLSWEDFLEATPRMVIFMKDDEWADDCIQMFINFWTAIHHHPWRHTSDHFSQQAIHLYQAQQCWKWHLT
ncbi:hypothetical protein HD554DRAFT_2026517, partial [Boletus coccyginus]